MSADIFGQQDDLFGDEPSLPYVRDSETSKAAAESMELSAATLRGMIYRLIETSPGMTCDEVEVRLNMRHQTASARIRELVQAGRITFDENVTRATRSGREARVYVARAA